MKNEQTNHTTSADKFFSQLPELVYPSKLTFDDGSSVEIAGIRFVDWQVTQFTSSLLANPLIVDSVNFNPDKVIGMAIQLSDSYRKNRKKIKSK